MSTKVKIIVAVAAAAVVAFFIWRRRAQAAQLEGITAGTPSTQTAVTALQTGVRQIPALATDAAIEKIGQVLPPVIGQGAQAVIGQTTPKPKAGSPCPPGYTGYNPTRPGEYCTGETSSLGGFLSKVASGRFG